MSSTYDSFETFYESKFECVPGVCNWDPDFSYFWVWRGVDSALDVNLNCVTAKYFAAFFPILNKIKRFFVQNRTFCYWNKIICQYKKTHLTCIFFSAKFIHSESEIKCENKQTGLKFHFISSYCFCLYITLYIYNYTLDQPLPHWIPQSLIQLSPKLGSDYLSNWSCT